MSVAAIAPARDITSDLIAFLCDAPGARAAFARLLGNRLVLATRQVLPRMDADMRSEIVQQAFVILLENPCRYDPARGTAASFLCQIVREASRAVRAAYAPPATRKRERADAPLPSIPVALHDVTEKETMQFAQARDGSAEAIEAACDIRHLLPHMPAQLILAFTSLAEGDTKVHAAQAAGITRFQFEARMTRFRREMRLAA